MRPSQGRRAYDSPPDMATEARPADPRMWNLTVDPLRSEDPGGHGMDAPMAGIVTIVFALLLSRKLGWSSDPARLPILIAAVLFSAALFLPTVAVTEQKSAWLIAAHLATALGALLLVIGMFQLERLDAGASDKTRTHADAEGGETAPQPAPVSAEPAPVPAEKAPEPHDPNDPYAGPHADKA